jgi:hypothetical protein
VCDFQKVLNAFRAAACNGREGLKGVGSANKLRKFKFCLAEGHRDVHRQVLRQAGTVSLHQDGRKGRLALRYKFCTNALQVKSGCIGQASLATKENGLDAMAISAGTMGILKKLCSPLHGRPFLKFGRKRSAKTTVDKKLFGHVKRVAEMIDTDAAADERRAGKILKCDDPSEDVRGELPSLMFANLGKTYSAKRNAFHAIAKRLRCCICC